jgi:cytochrome P450
VIARLREQMQVITDELLEAVAPAGRMEVVADLASPMPITVISRMLGVPEEDAGQFKKWTNDFIAYLGGETSLSQNLEAYHSFQELTAYFQELIPRRRSDPQEDLITLLVQADEEGMGLSEKEVIANCLLLLAAGHENTTRLISSGSLALLRHPDQMLRLRKDLSLLPSAVEELLRYDGPVQWTGRVVGETFDWNGRKFEKGERVTIGLAAANRDPAKFPDADRLDITRTLNRHLAFGNGPHFCLGAALTRMEGQVVFGALLAKFPRLRLDGVPVRSHSNFIFREILSLPVRMD